MVTGPEDLGNERWKSEQQMIDHEAAQARKLHELEKAEAENAADAGTASPAKRPWWKFWAN